MAAGAGTATIAGAQGSNPNAILPVPTPPTTRSQWTTQEWAEVLLQDMGVPVTQNNVNNILMWMSAESTSSSWLATNDPLNLRNTAEGGAFSFPDVQSGIAATASNLQSGDNGYPVIVAALQQNANPQTFIQAVAASNWDATHYEGTDFIKGLDGPLIAYATSTGGNPTGLVGQVEDAVPGASTAASALSDLGTIAGDLSSAAWWKRVGVFALGAAIFTIGLVGFISTTKPGQRIVSEGESAAAVAAVA